ncbi:c6 zinc finger domain containing protein [Grosmannia clavigera kw1407]|uniref:C6 zinc finger domain containing protein n=1 Tax=Grosmannia clavigera (strain kw1407 / UAMH 11150) TaxID=655863 RepID=F0XCU0_GROCL|nr:c6 zinc finger domain containing protein [Grosmannia clavigera kw1407]EFX04070.1 c6 zinc finger domain containing protein [Grosmannia clavigera kw1407]
MPQSEEMSSPNPTSRERRRCLQACGTCKRRKERCDGRQPCGRCSSRGVPFGCSFSRSQPPLQKAQATSRLRRREPPAIPPTRRQLRSIDIGQPYLGASNGTTSSLGEAAAQQHRRPSHGSIPRPLRPVSLAPVPHLSRLIQADRGRSLFFVGDSANLCFLQIIRRLVHRSVGVCSFTDDPVQHVFVEAVPNSGQTGWIVSALENRPTTIAAAEAANLLNWFLRSINATLCMFDAVELRENISQWLQQQSKEEPSHNDPNADSVMHQSVFFLILAIGAQANPEEDDDRAEKYFNHGRYLTLSEDALEPSVPTIQAYILMTVFLLGASRRNAAFMCLGTAVRAAYALGIYRSDVNSVFEPAECAPRERLWKALRILDLFLSTSMGRPPSTSETRNTKGETNYSASTHLCSIFEAILTEVYSMRAVSTATVEEISQQHRLWTSRFALGLAADSIPPEEYVDMDGLRMPNIGLVNLKGAYYWTIMLLSRPFLVEHVSRHISRQTQTHDRPQTPSPVAQTDDILTYACIDSATRALSIHRHLLTAEKIPRRLPFVANCVFVSALVLGLAQFGDFDRTFPIGKSLAFGQQLLALLGRHDAVSKRYAAIVADLQIACDSYAECRARYKMERHAILIGGLFGTVDDLSTAQVSARTPNAILQDDYPNSHSSQDCAEMDPTPTSTGSDDPFSMGRDGSTVEILADATTKRPDDHGSCARDVTDLQRTLEFNVDDDATPFPSTLSEMFLSTSPRVLNFDSFDRNLPLFSMMDGTMI